MIDMNEKEITYICCIAAILFLFSNISGLLLLFVAAEFISANKAQMFNAHFNGLLGTFWLLGIAFTYNKITLNRPTKRLFLYSAILASFALVVLSIIKSIANIASTNDSAIISFGYMITVVIPTFISSILWITGLGRNLKKNSN
tara:strand:+ start:249 stop:680 length:432 start_codon:yes stop_codon:yes gene_type:complete